MTALETVCRFLPPEAPRLSYYGPTHRRTTVGPRELQERESGRAELCRLPDVVVAVSMDDVSALESVGHDGRPHGVTVEAIGA